MRRHVLTIGISALFCPDATPHARTFLRALAQARMQLPAMSRVRLVCLDDGADPMQAARVAGSLVAAGVDIVVGHFSSDAALQAASHYERFNIALLTPAATIDPITHRFKNVFRFCPPDRKLARNLAWFAASRGWRRLQIRSDDSEHGGALAKAVRRACRDLHMEIAQRAADADAIVFAGRLAASRTFLQQRPEGAEAKPIILTDDAASPLLGAAKDGDPPCYVIGFTRSEQLPAARDARLRHLCLWGESPQTYFLESLAAFHVAAALATRRMPRAALLRRLATESFATPMGTLRFNAGELPNLTHEVLQLGSTGLTHVVACPA